MTTKLDAYFLCVCISYEKETDEKGKAKKSENTARKIKEYTIISNRDLDRILKGLTKDAIKDFDTVAIYIFFDDRSNIFANYNLTSYVALPCDNAMLDLDNRLFDKHLVTLLFAVDTEGKVIRV